MIQCELKSILSQQEKSLKQVHRATAIRMGTLCGLANGTWSHAPQSVLDRLCEYLQVTPAELLIYVPGESAKEE